MDGSKQRSALSEQTEDERAERTISYQAADGSDFSLDSGWRGQREMPDSQGAGLPDKKICGRGRGGAYC